MSKYNVFFGTYSKGQGNGLFRGEFDCDTGEIILKDTLDIENSSYLQLRDNILYGVSEVGEFDGEKGGALFSVDISDSSQMRLIDMKCTHGKSPCHLCVTDKTYKLFKNLIFVANYSEGSLSIFETGISGKIVQSCQSIHHFGKSVNRLRQDSSHIHFAAMTPDDEYLAVCDLGLDKVFLYPYSERKGISTNAGFINCPPGSGPRHMVILNKYLAYVLTEMGNTVLVYNYFDSFEWGEELLQEISTLPPDFTGQSTAAAIHISPDWEYLGASNRGHDSIAIFKIQDDCKLDFLSHIMTGKEPRDFRFSPDSRWIISANQNDDSVTVYKIENDNFIQTGNVSLPKPVCILFGEEIK